MILVVLAVLTLGGAATAGVVGVRFWAGGQLMCVGRTVSDDKPLMEGAIRALVAGPTQQESAAGISSWIPAGVSIKTYVASNDTVEVDLSTGILVGLDEGSLDGIFEQFRTTLGDFPSVTAIRLTCNGKLLSSYLTVTPSTSVPASPLHTVAASTTGLAGKKITIGPSHGRYYADTSWEWQRTDPCGFGDAVLEDTNSIRLCQLLKQYLSQDGAIVTVPRQLDETDGNDPDTGLPWWKMCASSWLHHTGWPCTMWANATGVCGSDTATNRYSDDIRARPLYADSQGADIYIAHHTNGAGGTGTEVFRDSQMEHPTHEANSLTLATQVLNNILSSIRDNYDSGWVSRGVKDSTGNFGEIRIPDRPAILIELAFHDTCTKDALYLTDDFFRSVSEWGIYNGVCAYFGVTPTWDKYSCEYVSDNLPSTMTLGQTYSATVTYRNRGLCWFTSRGFRLGSPSGTDPFAHVSRMDIDGEVKPGEARTFSFTMTAPNIPGVYTTNWQMVRDGYAWFGPIVRKVITVGGAPVEPPDNTGAALGGKTVDSQPALPTYLSDGWVSSGECGYPSYYSYTETPDCTSFDRAIKWQSAQSYSGRGHWTTDVQVPCVGATVKAKYTLLKPDGTDEGGTVWLDQCLGNGWRTLYDADRQDLNVGGWRTNTADIESGSGCDSTCGNRMLAAAGLHMYGDRWQYINDWTCLGAYSSTKVSDTHGFDEPSLYLYPAVDRTHGDVLLYGGKAAGQVTTGDSNNANSLDFKGNAAAYGADNADAYGFAWVCAPAGAAPKFLVGSDDGNRVWVNGALVNDNNASRALTRDQDETSAIALPTGWSRVLFKVHNATSGFAGTMSIRSGTDKRWNEQAVNVFDMGGYSSYGLGYEQDSWYPRLDVENFNGLDNPQVGAKVYTNNTTVTAYGVASALGPVPLWKVMHYEWGYGLGGLETNYADVTSNGVAWSHTQSGVYGHRRYQFFAVSQSHRTSFQSGPGSGRNGGSNWADGGPGNYMDVYVDATAPLAPSISSATAASSSQINLACTIPQDRGQGIGLGTTEYASTGGDNAYRRGDVGISVRRNSAVISGWGTVASVTDSGLSPNTRYTYDIAARDNTSLTRGAWNNVTSYVGAVSRWTLSAPPTTANVTCNRAAGPWLRTSDFAFTAVGGFGTGTVDHYVYAWDKSATHAFTGSESSWSVGQLAVTASSEGEWYLHVRGINGEAAANGTLDLGPYRYGTPPTLGTIADALAKAGSQPFRIESKAVTAALPGMFWLEESDRTTAVKVLWSPAVTAGRLVNVEGSLGMSGVQRVLFATTVDDAGEGTPPAAAYMNIRNLGGSAFSASTPGVTMGSGLYNIGMLVRIAGNVTYLNVDDPNAKFFYIDDGSGAMDDSGHPGVKILCGKLDSPGSGTVIVTGIVSSELVGTRVVPTLLVRDINDIKPL